MTDEVVYEVVDQIDASELLSFYERQKHETTHSAEKLCRMVERTFCLVSARQGGRLIGIARGVTDGVRGQLVECKLDPAYQGAGCITRINGRIEHDSAGIARQMALRVIDALCDYGVERIDVLAYGTEVDFCEELGFKKAAGISLLVMGTEKRQEGNANKATRQQGNEATRQ
ncbi:MAG: hypothetical protein KAV82_07185 [Phycisphaerae bacterium]|nr:hypothetical protein [Phycisphaerae bacterium]